MHRQLRVLALAAFSLSLSIVTPSAQTTAPVATTNAAARPGLKVTTPEQFFGHQIGADYVLPNYTRFAEYLRKLDADSSRMTVQSIGKTAEGRDQLMAVSYFFKDFKDTDTIAAAQRRNPELTMDLVNAVVPANAVVKHAHEMAATLDVLDSIAPPR